MNAMNENRVPENKAYKVTLILLVGLAAFSTAMKDLSQLQEMVGSVQQFASQWRGTEIAMLNVDSLPTNESCPNSDQSIDSGSSEGAASASDIEERIDTDSTEPEFGGKAEAAVSKKANWNVAHLGRGKYVAARTPNDEVSAKRRYGRWPAHFEFKTFDRAVTLDLPMTLVNDIKSGALENEASPDFPQSLLGKISRKQLRGKTDTRREFIFRTIERNISSRPVG